MSSFKTTKTADGDELGSEYTIRRAGNHIPDAKPYHHDAQNRLRWELLQARQSLKIASAAIREIERLIPTL